MTTNKKIKEIIRVNQAGEYGAKRVYEGQMDALKNHACFTTIQEMYKQELKHLEYFNNEISARRVRPTLLHPIWHGLGYCLGFITGKLGEKAAMACTIAIEETIYEHYQEQIDFLEKQPLQNKELLEKIKKFKAEEVEHREEHKAEEHILYTPMTKVIKNFSKAAIWISKRL